MDKNDERALVEILSLCDDTAGEAFRCFNRWCSEHDPDGNMDVLEQTIAYAEWTDKNSIERYLDAAQPVRNSR